MKLQSFTLQIFEPEKTLAFYINVLGFKLLNEFSKNDDTFYNLYFKNTSFYVQLKYTQILQKQSYNQAPTDNYWKYSLFVNDIQKAYKALQHQNHVIGEPFQFGDIGYLAHTTDVENHQIEFIQKTFKQNKPILPSIKTSWQDQIDIGLLTIRTKDPIKSIKFYEELLDLKLFVRMYVDRGNGFTLYFLGDKSLEVPNPDIDAIENREWMYQQSHLFIEIQHYWNSEYDDEFYLKSDSKNGLQSINFTGDLSILKGRLLEKDISFQEEEGMLVFKTLDGHTILFKNESL